MSLQSGIMMSKIQIVTGHNDRHDIIAGGDAILGPWSFVPVEYADELLEYVKKKYGRNMSVELEETRLIPSTYVPTLEEQRAKLDAWFGNKSNWGYDYHMEELRHRFRPHVTWLLNRGLHGWYVYLHEGKPFAKDRSEEALAERMSGIDGFSYDNIYLVEP